ncbi:MAG: glycosyl hydrolase 2 galactose-binding domain-containing protein [Planctomycetota bacterium]
MANRLTELRAHYAPYLQSLPQPLTPTPRVNLSGNDWLSRFEAKNAPDGIQQNASNWHEPNIPTNAWKRTTVPEWRYRPTKRNTGASVTLWYRKTFQAPAHTPGERVWLCFDGVDWQADVYLNGIAVGPHHGYHEPFRFDITQHLNNANNTLAVRVKSGQAHDEPAAYWSLFPVPALRDNNEGRYVRDRTRSLTNLDKGDTHTGDGYGIHREVYLKTTGPVLIQQAFARWRPNAQAVQVDIEADASTSGRANFRVSIMPENFVPNTPATRILEFTSNLSPGLNKIQKLIPLDHPAMWSPDTPHLYRCRVEATDPDNHWHNGKDVLFGARTFRIVTSREDTPDRPEGMFLLNGKPCQLRGTSVQGLNALHFWGERDKLLDVLLLLKTANFNAVRACQHVCFPEVRELLDRFGVLSQQDLGCRGLKSPDMLLQMIEATRALTRETYNNPGVVLLCYANECDFDPTPLVQTSLTIDPDRVSIPISGQKWGRELTPIINRETNPNLPDALWNNVVCSIHPYWGWYGRMADLPAIAERNYPKSRMQSIGEYGSEALDHYSTMLDYPKIWGPTPSPQTDTLWGHVQVESNDIRQLVGSRGVPAHALSDHITASQTFQSDQLHELTRSWRLMPKQINGYFQFHFIDVLPANWPKSILSHDLQPKAAYYTMAQLNQPLAPMAEIDNGGQSATLWIANSTQITFQNTTLRWRIQSETETLVAGHTDIPAITPGVLRVEQIPLTKAPADLNDATIALDLLDADAQRLSNYRHNFYIRAWRERGAP